MESMKGELIILSTVSDIENEEWVKMDALNMDSPFLLWTSDIFLIWISNSPSLSLASSKLGLCLVKLISSLPASMNLYSLPFLWPRGSIRSILAVEEKATIYSPGDRISPAPIVAQR